MLNDPMQDLQARFAQGRLQDLHSLVDEVIAERLRKLEHRPVENARVDSSPRNQRRLFALNPQKDGVDVDLTFSDSSLHLISCVGIKGSRHIGVTSQLLEGPLTLEHVEKQGDGFGFRIRREDDSEEFVLWAVSLEHAPRPKTNQEDAFTAEKTGSLK